MVYQPTTGTFACFKKMNRTENAVLNTNDEIKSL